MIRLILAEGCSAISGVEQLDYKEWSRDPRGQELEYSEHTWPAMLWKEKYPQAIYYPTARSGSSNGGIRRRVIHYVRHFLNDGYSPEEILVCIQWSSIDRIEFSRSQTHTIGNRGEFGYENLNPVYMQSRASNSKWLKLHRFDNVIKSLYANQYLDDDMLYYTYSSIDAVNTFCKSLGIRTIQSAGFEDMFLEVQKPNEFTQSLIEVNRPHIHYEFHPLNNKHKLGFFQYCNYVLDTKHIGPNGHPLKKGHQLWYEKIKQWYNIK
jgi:hypothetical protein